jgi:hypothetical protein
VQLLLGQECLLAALLQQVAASAAPAGPVAPCRIAAPAGAGSAPQDGAAAAALRRHVQEAADDLADGDDGADEDVLAEADEEVR